MLFRHIPLTVLLCIVICTGQYNGRQQVEAAERPAALILYPGATDIRFDERGDGDTVSYHVTSKFPATPVIELISYKLKKAGWEPLKYYFLNPNPDLPSSHVTGWTYFFDGTKDPTQCVHQWSGDWKDPSGNIVTYMFRYEQLGCSTLALTDLEVLGVYATADVARQTQQFWEKWKKDHNLK